jgi:hypothetical protein
MIRTRNLLRSTVSCTLLSKRYATQRGKTIVGCNVLHTFHPCNADLPPLTYSIIAMRSGRLRPRRLYALVRATSLQWTHLQLISFAIALDVVLIVVLLKRCFGGAIASESTVPEPGRAVLALSLGPQPGPAQPTLRPLQTGRGINKKNEG